MKPSARSIIGSRKTQVEGKRFKPSGPAATKLAEPAAKNKEDFCRNSMTYRRLSNQQGERNTRSRGKKPMFEDLLRVFFSFFFCLFFFFFFFSREGGRGSSFLFFFSSPPPSPFFFFFFFPFFPPLANWYCLRDSLSRLSSGLFLYVFISVTLRCWMEAL